MNMVYYFGTWSINMTVGELKQMIQDLPDNDEILWKIDFDYNYKLYQIQRQITPNEEETVCIWIEEE